MKKIIDDHRPLQMLFLSCSFTSVKLFNLLKSCKRITFLWWGVVTMLSSSAWFTSLPMPSAIIFVWIPPTVK